MSGKAGRSGRKKGSGVCRADALHRMTLLAPLAVDTIQETIEGANKDRLKYEAAIEVYNHNFGKAKQSTDLDIKGGRELGAGVVIELFKLIAQKRAELESAEYKQIPIICGVPKLIGITEGKDAIEQGTEQEANEIKETSRAT